jgi:hypothetical protein
MASGDTLIILKPQASTPLASGTVANLDTRNGHPIVLFVDAATTGRAFPIILPRNYAGGGITAYLHWCGVPTSGNVVWGGAFERHQAATDDLDSDSFATEQTATGAISGTSGVITTTSIAFTSGQIDGLAVGESGRFRVQRLGGDGSDTTSGDAQLLGVELKET